MSESNNDSVNSAQTSTVDETLSKNVLELNKNINSLFVLNKNIELFIIAADRMTKAMEDFKNNTAELNKYSNLVKDSSIDLKNTTTKLGENVVVIDKAKVDLNEMSMTVKRSAEYTAEQLLGFRNKTNEDLKDFLSSMNGKIHDYGKSIDRAGSVNSTLSTKIRELVAVNNSFSRMIDAILPFFRKYFKSEKK